MGFQEYPSIILRYKFVLTIYGLLFTSCAKIKNGFREKKVIPNSNVSNIKYIKTSNSQNNSFDFAY